MRIRILFKPRDLWIGVYWDRRHVGWQGAYGAKRSIYEYSIYICLIPCLPIRLRWDNFKR